MGGDFCMNGREVESQCFTVCGTFFTFICCKIVLMFQKTENMQKCRE